MEKTIEELREEATELGLTYSQNIGAAKLSVKIDEYYEKQSAGDIVEDIVEEIEVEVKKPATKAKSASETAEQKFRRESKERQVAALKTKIVTITNTDKRESHVETMAYLSCGVVSKRVPLDIPIELEIALIEVARTSTVSTHVDEVVKGVRTGNKVPKTVRKYVVSYEDIAK